MMEQRILVLESCGFDHFLAASQAVAARSPGSAVIGLVRASDETRARASGRFAEVHRLDAEAPVLPANHPIDMCVVPFEGRLGVRAGQFRSLPLRFDIPAIGSYNGRGRLRVWGRAGWRLNTFLICKVLPAVYRPVLTARFHLSHYLDAVTLFCLGGVALVLHGARMLVAGPAGRESASDSATGRIRVVLFIPNLGVGGTQKQLVTFLRHLDRERLDVELVTLDLPDKFFEPDVRALGVPITYLNRHREFWRAGVVWRLMRHLRARPCHVLHGWLHYAAALGAIAGRLAGTPVVMGSLRSESPGRFPWFYSKSQRGLDILTAYLQTALIANSKSVREESRSWAFIPERKLFTVSNGIDVDASALMNQHERDKLRAELNLPVGAPVVGIIGRLWPEKDHATFLKAAQRISRVRPDTQYVVVGDGNLRGWIESESARLGLSGRVHVLGDRKDAWALLQILDVLALTSTSEGFPNVLLEAAATGTAVVTTAAGGAAEVVLDGETGFVVPCGNAEAVAGRILALLSDTALRSRLAGAARDRVRACFSAERMATAIQSLYGRDWAKAGAPAVRPLRVCFISTFAYGVLQPSSELPVGGAEVQICSLARQLARDARFDVRVLTGHKGREGMERSGDVTVVLGSVFRQLQVTPGDGFGGNATDGASRPEQVRQWLDRRPPVVARTIRSLVRGVYTALRWVRSSAAYRWLSESRREYREVFAWLRLLRAIDADIYVMRCASPQVGYVRLVCRLFRRRLVYMVAHENDVSGTYARTQGRWGTRFEKGLVQADAIVCQHAQQVDLLRTRYDRGGHLIRSLCPTPLCGLADLPRKTILWIARLDAWKQPDLFIELARRLPDERFVMIGPPSPLDPDNLPRLQRLAETLPNLRFSSGVPFDRTNALFSEAKVFVNTSQYEGFPNTFLQAAACGTPIVSWAVNPDGILDRFEMGSCAGADWNRFEQGVRLLCRDDTMRTRLGDNGRRYVREHHDPAVLAAEYADLFLSLRDQPVQVA